MSVRPLPVVPSKNRPLAGQILAALSRPVRPHSGVPRAWRLAARGFMREIAHAVTEDRRRAVKPH